MSILWSWELAGVLFTYLCICFSPVKSLLITDTFTHTELLHSDVVLKEDRCKRKSFLGDGRMPFFCLDYL